ncbi:MAG: hypothetical protein P1V35_04435, partial [Planctomycetota bacterium]|nr:hypothetical protein [Planctomycetota bacterium]
NTNGSHSGGVTVYSGANHSILWDYPGDPGAGLGVDLVALGDASGDGIPDFALGQGGDQGGGNGGAINVLSGATGELLFRRTYYNTTASPTTGEVGWDLLPVGDWNGDGLADLAYTLRGLDSMGQFFGGLRIEGNWFGGEGQHFCDTEPNSSGQICILEASTQPASPSGWHLDAAGGPPGEFAYFLMGTGINPSTIVIDSGSLCLGTAIGRYNHSGTNRISIGIFNAVGDLNNLSGTSASGMGYDVPMTLPLPGTPLIQSGETYHFQVWYRDQTGGATTSNLSSGLSIEF